MESSTTIRPQWFAVQTRYRYEQRVAGDLAAKGVENYLPLLREVHSWKDRRKWLEVPAFGGYIFVRLEETPRSRVRVLETNGVIRVLGGRSGPEPVPDSEIESLRLSLGSGAPCVRHPYLAAGTLLRIDHGPLRGLEGRLVRTANALRVVVCVASIGQAIAVEVARRDVVPIAEIETAVAERLRKLESRACELIEMQVCNGLQPNVGGGEIVSSGPRSHVNGCAKGPEGSPGFERF
jgi:transcription antitermination factor NusG